MSYGEWYCGHCGHPLTDDCIRIDEDDPGSGYCFDCADKITNAFLKAQAVARGVEFRRGDVLVPEFWEFRELKEQVEAHEEHLRRVTSVWRLWLNDAERGSINPGTFDAMKNLLGM